MKRVKWHSDAIDDLVKHDAWRISHDWEPIGGEILDAVTVVLTRDDVYPRQRCRVYGEIVPVYRTQVAVRSKQFLVYFLAEGTRRVVRRILHPRRNRADVEQ